MQLPQHSTNMSYLPDNTRLGAQKMEIAAKNIDKFIAKDYAAPTLLNVMNIAPGAGPTVSGLTDHDYPILNASSHALNAMTQIKVCNKIPLPHEIMEHFAHVQCHCMMGLFPEINRAWLTVDSDLYIWTYEENSDLAYFDGLNETILSVGLVKPKTGVFHNFIKYLLVLSTAVDIIVLGVTFADCLNNPLAEIQLIPDPVFTVPTDSAVISTIVGTRLGRIFLGSKEGNLYEISYQAESGWFGKRCKKVNHSTSALSFLVPSFLNAALTDEDGLVQISVDDTRNILYLLSEKGSIEVCDLGEHGTSFSRVTKVSQASLVQQAMNIVKTLDSQNFRPIVNISTIESRESVHLNLVAVTQTGVRLYLSTSSLANQQPNPRPSTLCLHHVRLPPGYSANITVRPRAVHAAHHRDGNLVLLSTVNEKDVLWCVSSDLFPFSHTLREAYTTISLDSPAIAISEVRHDCLLEYSSQEVVPLAVRQHYEPPKKYVVLTSQAVYIMMKLRPVDLLKKLLMDSQGHDSEAVKSFFIIETEDQACATSLILASLESENNAYLSEYATRAFFVFGGEPKLSPIVHSNMFSGSSVFSPNIISTPAPHHLAPKLRQNQNVSFDLNLPFQFSAKHNGLYLYFGRILRPVWNRKCVEKVYVDSKTVVVTTTVTSDDCIKMLNNLTALHNFLLINTQLCLCPGSASSGQQPNQSVNMSMTQGNFTLQDAQLEERQSLDALKLFVNHCCQVLGLWKVLCEHQFHTLIGTLPDNQQTILLNTTFKDLFLYGQDICTVLISTLINSYLGDNASVDSISAMLRQVCPSFYRTEDAAFSKANEMLKSCISTQNTDEKEDLINSALNLCKDIAPNINLNEVCRQFTNLKAYKAVIELCHICATKMDPDKISEHFYKSSNSSDEEGYHYYQRRMEIYKNIVNMLDVVHDTSQTLNASILNCTVPTITEGASFNMLTKQLIHEILEYDDQIMHSALYRWMIANNMTNDLIKLDNPSLEIFLTHNSQQNSDSKVMDLLWKYYESNNKHSSAAKILSDLASTQGDTVDLKQRIAYLARAVMCMSNSKTGYAPCLGVYTSDLEDKLDVAKVQEQVLVAFLNIRTGHNPQIEEAISALNSGLYHLSQLYENFAEPFNLWECKLAIIDCAGYSNWPLVESIWKNILKHELKNSVHCRSSNDRLSQLLATIRPLARHYVNSVNCFPLEYIVHELEIVSATLKADKSLVPGSLIGMNVSMEKLMSVYNKLVLVTSNEGFWKTEENEFHFAESISALINCFLEDSGRYNNVVKRKIISLCQDTVAGLLSNLYSKPNTDDLVNVLRNIQAKLSRL